MRTNFKNSCK